MIFFGSDIAVADSEGEGRVYLIDGDTGMVFDEILNPAPTSANDNFGYAMAEVTGGIAIGAPRADSLGVDDGLAYVFDANGNLRTTLNNPAPSADPGVENFGLSVAGVEMNVLVGAPSRGTAVYRLWGAP